MFERFTDRARRVVVLAQEDARERKHSTVGVHHILMGLSRENEGVAARALTTCGITIDVISFAITNWAPEGSYRSAGHIPLTTGAKEVYELSLREALEMGHNYIGTEHILLALLRSCSSAGYSILGVLPQSFTVDEIEDAVMDIIDPNDDEEETTVDEPVDQPIRWEANVGVSRWECGDQMGIRVHPRGNVFGGSEPYIILSTSEARELADALLESADGIEDRREGLDDRDDNLTESVEQSHAWADPVLEGLLAKEENLERFNSGIVWDDTNHVGMAFAVARRFGDSINVEKLFSEVAATAQGWLPLRGLSVHDIQLSNMGYGWDWEFTCLNQSGETVCHQFCDGVWD